MEEYVVSACLYGIKCRYNGKDKKNDYVRSLVDSGKAIPMCPEVLGGLSTPRKPAECVFDESGVKVITEDGKDVTNAYNKGADIVLDYAKKHNIKKAILCDKSPSCGLRTYDGTFSGNLIDKPGVTAQKLLDNGIEIISSDELK